jgi:hypothetical protein
MLERFSETSCCVVACKDGSQEDRADSVCQRICCPSILRQLWHFFVNVFAPGKFTVVNMFLLCDNASSPHDTVQATGQLIQRT